MKTLLSIAAAFLAIAAQAAAPFTVHIKGTVFDRPESETVILFRARENPRLGVEIPIVNGQFYYDLTTDIPEMWELAIQIDEGGASWMTEVFFAEPGDVSITLNSAERWHENTLSGGTLNTEYAAYQAFAQQLYIDFERTEADLTKRGFKEIYYSYDKNPDTDKLQRIEHDENLDTPEGRAMSDEYKAAFQNIHHQQREYLRQHPGEAAYAVIYRELVSSLHRQEDPAPWLALLAEGNYAERFPENPYRKLVADLLRSEEQLKVGGHYIDFTLPDLDGNMVTVSDLVDGKIALIDLWMTWCGPCRSGLMEAIPVWNEFRDRGFVVVTASGDNSLIAIRNAARHDGHPWPTLVDLGGAAGLYARYGLSNAGGSSYLIDRDGTILAINPSAEKLRTILTEKLH